MPKTRVVVLVFLCSYSFFIHTLYAQLPSSVKGQWIGKLSQEQGGYLEEYTFEIFFQTDQDGLLAGKTYVRAPNVLGVFSFTGKKRGQVLYLSEKELRHSRKPQDLSWCFKTMQLRLVQRNQQWFLEGPWQGNSDYGVCIPGWLSLRWIPPQA